jgi:ABC-type polysaccharide/polyol phosphate transport system ATPase subunit
MKSIIIKNLSKKYKLNDLSKKSIFSKKKKSKDFYALSNINLSINKGECIGVIGPNGSGKTTFLKLIGDITTPTTGSIISNGNVLSFLDLNAGFQEELTGRENVYLYGSITGLTKKTMNKYIDEIISFSGLSEFIDIKLKNYSTGMKMRLGFATSMAHNPDIILLDEVLSVGDEIFQKRSMNKILTLKNLGKTIVIVSHMMDNIRDIADKVIYLKDGKIKSYDTTLKVIQEYTQDSAIESYADLDLIKDLILDINKLEKEKKSLKPEENSFFNFITKQKTKNSINNEIIYLKDKINDLIIPIESLIDKEISFYEKLINKKSNEKLNKKNLDILKNLLKNKIYLCDVKIGFSNSKDFTSRFLNAKNQAMNKQIVFDSNIGEKKFEKKFEYALNEYREDYNKYKRNIIMEDIVLYSSKIDLSNIKNEILDREIKKTVNLINSEGKTSLFRFFDNILILTILDESKLKKNSENVFNYLIKHKSKNEVSKFVTKQFKIFMGYKSHNLILCGHFSLSLLHFLFKTNINLSKKDVATLEEFIDSWIFDAETSIASIKRKSKNNSNQNFLLKEIDKLSYLKGQLLGTKSRISLTTKDYPIVISKIDFMNKKGQKIETFHQDEPITFCILYHSKHSFKSFIVGIDIFNEEGFCLSKFKQRFSPTCTQGEIKNIVSKLTFGQGRYYVSCNIHPDKKGAKSFELFKWFRIKSSYNEDEGIIKIQSKWSHTKIQSTN